MSENPARRRFRPALRLIMMMVISCYSVLVPALFLPCLGLLRPVSRPCSGFLPVCFFLFRTVRLLSDLWGATKNKGAENQPLAFDLVGMTRLELATSRPPDACANQLRYIPSSAISFLYCGCKITHNLRELQIFADVFCKRPEEKAQKSCRGWGGRVVGMADGMAGYMAMGLSVCWKTIDKKRQKCPLNAVKTGHF